MENTRVRALLLDIRHGCLDHFCSTMGVCEHSCTILLRAWAHYINPRLRNGASCICVTVFVHVLNQAHESFTCARRGKRQQDDQKRVFSNGVDS
jgi:hypothetical protein